MAQRRPIASHPAFAPLLALWFAALLGLAVAVLPAGLLARGLAASGLESLDSAGPLAASGAAAVAGAVAGFLLARLLARRAARDPRPVYFEPEPDFEEPAPVERRRRPLSIREELAEGFPEERVPEPEAVEIPAPDRADDPEPGESVEPVEAAGETPPQAIDLGTDFLILSPQPVHPPSPAPDLEALLEQFDTALAAFRSGEEPRSATPRPAEADPVHAFVARQTGTPAPSPLGGTIPDHQSELRAALDKLARARRADNE